MSDELVRKSDVLELIGSLNISDRQIYEDLIFNVEDMSPVKAVELPCEIGDKIYWVTNAILERQLEPFCLTYNNEQDIGVCEFTFRALLVNKKGFFALTQEIPAFGLSINKFDKTVFLSRTQAERALEELSNDT